MFSPSAFDGDNPEELRARYERSFVRTKPPKLFTSAQHAAAAGHSPGQLPSRSFQQGNEPPTPMLQQSALSGRGVESTSPEEEARMRQRAQAAAADIMGGMGEQVVPPPPASEGPAAAIVDSMPASDPNFVRPQRHTHEGTVRPDGYSDAYLADNMNLGGHPLMPMPPQIASSFANGGPAGEAQGFYSPEIISMMNPQSREQPQHTYDPADITQANPEDPDSPRLFRGKPILNVVGEDGQGSRGPSAAAARSTSPQVVVPGGDIIDAHRITVDLSVDRYDEVSKSWITGLSVEGSMEDPAVDPENPGCFFVRRSSSRDVMSNIVVPWNRITFLYEFTDIAIGDPAPSVFAMLGGNPVASLPRDLLEQMDLQDHISAMSHRCDDKLHSCFTADGSDAKKKGKKSKSPTREEVAASRGQQYKPKTDKGPIYTALRYLTDPSSTEEELLLLRSPTPQDRRHLMEFLQDRICRLYAPMLEDAKNRYAQEWVAHEADPSATNPPIRPPSSVREFASRAMLRVWLNRCLCELITNGYHNGGAESAAVESPRPQQPSAPLAPPTATTGEEGEEGAAPPAPAPPVEAPPATEEPQPRRLDPNLLLAKATSATGFMASMLIKFRSLVSRKKKRWMQDGLNLDLAYIADDIIAVGFPSEGKEAMFRNPLNQVLQFFEMYHGNGAVPSLDAIKERRFISDQRQLNYRIFNLCSERYYAPTRFGGSFARFPSDDHEPPPLSLLLSFCRAAAAFLGDTLRAERAEKGRAMSISQSPAMSITPTAVNPSAEFPDEAPRGSDSGIAPSPGISPSAQPATMPPEASERVPLSSAEASKLPHKPVIAVHCKAGKGRTGVMIVALLLYTGRCPTLKDALHCYNSRRVKNMKGVTISSQIRFLQYFEHMLKQIGPELPRIRPVRLHTLQLAPAPWYDLEGGCTPYVLVRVRKPDHLHVPLGRREGCVNDAMITVLDTRALANRSYYGNETAMIDLQQVEVHDEVQVQIFTKTSPLLRRKGKDEYMCGFWVHTSFLDGRSGSLWLNKTEIDGASKDSSHLFDDLFGVQLQYTPMPPRTREEDLATAAL